MENWCFWCFLFSHMRPSSQKYIINTVLTWKQDDSPEIKHLIRKIIYSELYTLNTHSVSVATYLSVATHLSVATYLYHSVSLSPSSQSVPSSSSHSILTSPSSPSHCHSTTYYHQSFPLHWICNTSCNPSQSLLVECTAILLTIHSDQILYLYF